MLSCSSSSSLVARKHSAKSKIKKLVLAASLFLINSIIQDLSAASAIAVLEGGKTETGIVPLTELQPTENEFVLDRVLPSETYANPLSSAIVSLNKERRAEFRNAVELMREYNAKLELQNSNLSEYLVNEAMADLINRIRLTLKMTPEEKEKIGSWAFYTCFENDVLYLVDRANDFQALADLIMAYDIPIRMNTGLVDFT